MAQPFMVEITQWGLASCGVFAALVPRPLVYESLCVSLWCYFVSEAVNWGILLALF